MVASVLWGPTAWVSGLGVNVLVQEYRSHLGAGFLVLCGLASLHPLTLIATTISGSIREFLSMRRDERRLLSEIPNFSDKEKEIISYLLHHNQRIFTHEITGGYASTLIARGFIRTLAQTGQPVRGHQVPFTIPAHFWSVLQQHREQFPYTPRSSGATLPWAVPWQAL